jgi:hypothetical protein
MDDAMKEACRFYNRHYEGMEGLAPAQFSAEEQHALTILAAYIREQGVADKPVGTSGASEP